MIVCRHALLLLDAIGSQQRERVAQVVAAGALHLAVAVDIAAAHGRADNGNSTLLLYLVHNPAQPLLISIRRCGTTSIQRIGFSRHTFTYIIVIHLVAIHTANLLVVMSEGDDDIVAGFHLLLGSLPQLVVATT